MDEEGGANSALQIRKRGLERSSDSPKGGRVLEPKV